MKTSPEYKLITLCGSYNKVFSICHFLGWVGGMFCLSFGPHVGLHHVIVSQMFPELCFLTCFSARVIEENAANDPRQCQTGDLSPGLLPVVVPD